MKTSLRSMLLVLLLNLAIGTCMQGRAPPPAPPEWLYHYTSKENFLKIVKSGQIKPSNDDLICPGVYFTELTPDSTDQMLLDNIYYEGQLDKQAKNVEYAVAIRRQDLAFEKLEGGCNIWIIEPQNEPEDHEYVCLQPSELAALPIGRLQYKVFRRGDGNSAGQAFKADRDTQIRLMEHENTIQQMRLRIAELEKAKGQLQQQAVALEKAKGLLQQQAVGLEAAVSYPEVIEVSGREGRNRCINGDYYRDAEKHNGQHMWKRRDKTEKGNILLIRLSNFGRWEIHGELNGNRYAVALVDTLWPTQARIWMVDEDPRPDDPAVVVRAQ